MNRQFKKSVSAAAMFFMLLTLIVPFQAAFAASAPVTGFNYSTGTTQAVYGAPYGVDLVVSDVTDTVSQQVYEHEAILNYDPSILEVSRIVNTDASYFNDPVVTELAPGQTKLVYQVTSPAKPYLLTDAAKPLSQVIFSPKVNPSSNTSTMISMTAISITNGQGDKLALDDVSTTIDILPPGNKTELQTLVDKANAAYNGTTEGTQEGQFAVGSKAVLKTHIDEAQTALNGVGGTKAAPTSQFQSKLDAQAADLSAAVHTFKAGLTGQYRINFTALKDASDAVSTMGGYFLKPYTLKLSNGAMKVSFTLKDSTVVPSLKVEQNGVYTETDVLSEDTAANTRVVEFEVNDLSSILNAKVHVSTKMPDGSSYEMDHKIRLKFDSLVDAVNMTALNAAISSAQAVYNNAVVGSETGEYSAESKAALQTAIAAAKAAANDAALTQTAVDQAAATLQTALSIFAFTVNGAVYDLNFTVMHATKDQASSMDSYFLKPGKVTVQDGRYQVMATLKDSTTVPSFKVEQNGALTETTVLSTDTVNNTRVLTFPVQDLTALLNAQVHVSTTMPGGGSYEMDHAIRLKFDEFAISNKAALNDAIAQAQTVHDAAVEGSAAGQYPAGAKGALQTAIDAAKAVANHPGAGQTTVDNAATALQTALAAFHASVITTGTSPTDPNALADGEYTIGYTILKDGTEESSVMEEYTLKPAKLDVAGGKRYISLTLTHSDWIQFLQTQQNGAYVDAEVVSPDTPVDGMNQRVVKFEIADFANKVNAYTHVKIPDGVLPFPYDNKYYVQFKFDGSSIAPVNPNPGTGAVNKTQLNTLISQAQSEHDAAVEGTSAGQYPAGAKGTLQTAIDTAKAVANHPGAEQTTVDNAATALQTALIIFHASVITTGTNPTDPDTLTDGEYTIGFAVLKDGTEETSVMDGYTVKPAKLDVISGKKYISLTLTNSDWIQFFQTQQNGVYVDAEVVSPDTPVDGVNQRVVKFEIADFTNKVNAYTHVKIPDGVLPFPYDNKYYVQFKFDGSTIESADGSTPTNPTAPLEDGDYTFGFQATSVDPSGEPIGNYLDSAGKVKIESGKNIVTFKVKNGATLSKLLWIKANGETKEFLPKAVAKAAGLVRVLSADAGTTTDVQFELEQLSGTYIANFAVQQSNGTVERAYQLTFNNITAEDPSTPGNGGNNGGNTGGNTGGGSNGGNGGNGGTGGNSSSLADGKYSISYRIVKYETDETSVMQDYVMTPGVLTVEGGKQYVSFTLKQSKEITDFQVEQGGSLVDTSVISSDEVKNTRTVQFEVPDLSARMKGWVKIKWPEFNYFHDYDVHISFDKSSIKKLSDSAAAALGGGGTKESTLKNGDYDIAFKALQSRNNLESKVNDYILHPGTLTIKDKERFISLTLLKNKEITEFKVKSNDELIDADVVSTNEEENSRIVKFEVKDLSATLPAHLKWVAEDGTEEEIDFDIVFDVDSLGKDPAEETPAENEPGTEEPATPQEPSSSGLQDIQDHWAKASIERAIALGIVNGYEDGTFRPDGEVSRAEFTAMIGRALKLQNQEGELPFADKDRIPSWVKPTLAQAVEEGIISSYEDSTFRAERKITRAEIAVMIVRALKLPQEESAELPFADANDIPDWAKAQVAAAHGLGMINGRENNVFAPNASATRAEAVTLILAMLNYVQ